ncbi:hypothetical protein IT157_00410, partial [bacterium]|nr:hypothetical protein [bacterium]
QYQEIVTKFGSNPELKAIVDMAKEKIVEKLFTEGKYNAILEMYPDSKMAKEAKNMLAEGLLAEGKLDEVIAKYPESPAAMKAKLQKQQMMTDSLAAVVDSTGKKLTDVEKSKQATQKQLEQKTEQAENLAETAAARELDKILNIKVPAAKRKALEEFLKKPEYKNTAAYKRAQDAMAKL